jgi:hypothetical protein
MECDWVHLDNIIGFTTTVNSDGEHCMYDLLLQDLPMKGDLQALRKNDSYLKLATVGAMSPQCP